MPKKLVLPLVLLSISIFSFGETIDRVVATVNGHAILQSDWEDAIRYEAFTNGVAIDHLSPGERKAALDHLIDQELLREQMRSSETQKGVAEESVNRRVAELREQYARTGEAWERVLARYCLSEEELRRRISQQLLLMRQVDARLRPTIQIDSKSIESYYQQSLLPQLRKSGAQEIPLNDVFPRIKEVLTQQKLDQLLAAWLESLRASSEIHGGTPSQAADR
jgi:hypothetical protein